MHTNTIYKNWELDRDAVRYPGEPVRFDSRPVMDIAAERRRGAERREQPCPGCTYVSPVGWICRREQVRRREDGCPF